ncbi:hypothetical protein FSP39_008016 [Pinctada imbricata]|uniref:Uncharacterized protein n=1 Tax=Pinctada imbricata TaxID=66713 RepID=A0AA89BLP9_PINIB|nr:hypothetical protein FSP39_008016 [Pinctada imbricata]
MEAELEKTKRDLKQQKWAVEKIKDNDSATKFYTGIPTFAIFLWIFNYLQPKAENMTYWRGNEAACTDRQRSTTTTLRFIVNCLSDIVLPPFHKVDYVSVPIQDLPKPSFSSSYNYTIVRSRENDTGVQNFKGLDRAVQHFDAGDIQDISLSQVSCDFSILFSRK